MIAGLTIAPASIALAKPAQTSVVVAGGMECCPKKQGVPTCPKCSLMALCATPVVDSISDVALAVPPFISAAREMPADELDFTGRNLHPSPPPPRSMV